MTNYVALLRGINVGGNNLIKMDQLRAQFAQWGLASVHTYIQSGNVLFKSDHDDRKALQTLLEKNLESAFHYNARVILRSLPDMARTLAAFPSIFAARDWRHNVIFLADAIDVPDLVFRFNLKPELETLTYAPGVLFWSARLEGLTRSQMTKLSSRKEYQEMTVRNVKTTTKIYELLQALQ